jgi:hypothetical protein
MGIFFYALSLDSITNFNSLVVRPVKRETTGVIRPEAAVSLSKAQTAVSVAMICGMTTKTSAKLVDAANVARITGVMVVWLLLTNLCLPM